MQSTRRILLAGAVASGLCRPHVACAAVRVAKLGVNNKPDSQYGVACQALADAVAADHGLASFLKIDVRFNAELGDELAMMTDCRQSTIDMALCTTLVAGAFCPEAGLLDAPFIFKSVAQGRAAMDGTAGADYAALLKAKDIHVLAWAENGSRHIASSRPIRTPEDLKGLKLRLPQSGVMLSSFRSLGADAKPLAFTQLYEALRTGEFEAHENVISAMESMRAAEVQKYLSLTGHVYSTALFMASPELLEDLPAPQAAALRDAARKGAAVSRSFADAAQRDGVKRLQQAGMTVVEGIDIGQFIAACRPGMEALGKQFGMDSVNRLISAGA